MAGPRPQEIDRYVGSKILELREAAGLTQHQLADLIGVSYQQVHKYERGINRVACSRLYAISKALRCGVGDLFPPLNENWGLTATVNLMEDVVGLNQKDQNVVALAARRFVEKEAADG